MLVEPGLAGLERRLGVDGQPGVEAEGAHGVDQGRRAADLDVDACSGWRPRRRRPPGSRRGWSSSGGSRGRRRCAGGWRPPPAARSSGWARSARPSRRRAASRPPSAPGRSPRRGRRSPPTGWRGRCGAIGVTLLPAPARSGRTSRPCRRSGAAAARPGPAGPGRTGRWLRDQLRPGPGQPVVDAGRLLVGEGADAVDQDPTWPYQRDGRIQEATLQPARRATSPGCTRQRASGRRRSTPRPEQGASTRTRSKVPARQGGRVPSATTVTTGVAARRATVAAVTAPRASEMSAATTRAGSAPARAVALPPGAAHMSRMRSPGPAPTWAATSWLARSWA